MWMKKKESCVINDSEEKEEGGETMKPHKEESHLTNSAKEYGWVC